MDHNFATTWTQKATKVSGTISWSSSVDCAGLIARSAAFENNFLVAREGSFAFERS